MREVIVTDKLAPAVGPYSRGVKASGLIFLSGLIPQDPSTGKLVEGDITAQTHQIFRNLEVLAKAAGKTLNEVAKATVYLANMEDFAAMNSVYGTYFKEPYPARTAIAVKSLPLGAQIEIDVILQ